VRLTTEAGDFTPWLAEEANLAQLAESLGIDVLELSSAGLTTLISASC
jgi:hypothetical protein